MNRIKIFVIIMLLVCLGIAGGNSFGQETGTNTPTTSQNGYKLKSDKFNKFVKKLEKVNENKVIADNSTMDININTLWDLLIDIITMVLIISLIYYPKNRQMEKIFTFIMFNIIIFMLTFVLNKLTMSMGAAFGLFAVFSMLRYRTEGLLIKDLTYLFIFIALGLISAIQLKYYELGLINGIILIFTYILDGKLIFRENSKLINYENIELIKPDKAELLIEDLKKRTGLQIHHIIIEDINFLNDTANIKIFYNE